MSHPPLTPIRPARLTFTDDGTPASVTFGDVYFSADGGPGQARHVFLGGNDLPERWRDKSDFVILETGFGTGLNFLTTWAAWRANPDRPQTLHYLSVEKHPFTQADLLALHAKWPELAELSPQLCTAWPLLVPGFHRLEFEQGRVCLTLMLGDAQALLPQLQARVDAFYLDGFAPDRNPEMWSPELFKRLARLGVPGATLATWSVAAAVRHGLESVGFEITRRPGFGRKREMLSGQFKPQAYQPHAPPLPPLAERRAVIVGAGLAGTAITERLARRGWSLTLIDRHPGPAMAASGNPAGIVLPLVSRDDNQASRLSRAAFLHALRQWPQLPDLGDQPCWSPTGVLQIARDARHAALQRGLVEDGLLPRDFVDFLDRAAASARLGQRIEQGGWFFPGGGWASPARLCRARLHQARSHTAAPHITTLYGQSISRIAREGEGWRLYDDQGRCIAEAPTLILASGAEAADLDQTRSLPVSAVRGQVSLLPEGTLNPLEFAVCREGYATPAVDGVHCAGASYSLEDDATPNAVDNAGNLTRLARLLPDLERSAFDPETLPARVGFRAVAPDRLPLVGALPDPAAPIRENASQLRDMPRHPGLFGLLGLASRGLVWADLMADLLTAQIEHLPYPIETSLADAVDPARFLLKQVRRGKR